MNLPQIGEIYKRLLCEEIDIYICITAVKYGDREEPEVSYIYINHTQASHILKLVYFNDLFGKV